MPNIHGRNATLIVYDATGASRNVSGDLNTMSLAWTRDNPEKTTFGFDSKQRMSGLRDGVLNGAGILNTTACAEDDILGNLMAASTIALVKYIPVNIAGCPFYSACMLLNQYSPTAPVGGVQAFSFSFQLASGSISPSTV